MISKISLHCWEGEPTSLGHKKFTNPSDFQAYYWTSAEEIKSGCFEYFSGPKFVGSPSQQCREILDIISDQFYPYQAFERP